MNRAEQLFSLTGRTAIITGGAGLLGPYHGAILAAAGANVIILGLDLSRCENVAAKLTADYGIRCIGMRADVTDEDQLIVAKTKIMETFGHIDILVNNAANNPKVEDSEQQWHRVENLPIQSWNDDIAVGLTGVFLCSRVFAAAMVRGVIVNIASELSVIAPDQRLYLKSGVSAEHQPVKPITYSVVKTGILGLTRYLGTYWSHIRVNALSPSGVLNGQPEEFVSKICQLIPMGRMAAKDEYQGAILFLCSDASQYMTGQNLIVDGGRSVL